MAYLTCGEADGDDDTSQAVKYLEYRQEQTEASITLNNSSSNNKSNVSGEEFLKHAKFGTLQVGQSPPFSLS